MQLGERMKMYEGRNAPMLMPGLPAFARLDGKNFSKFTKSLEKPYDSRLSMLMIDLTKFLITETNTLIGYTQSDEITLMWYNENNKEDIFYNGRVMKMVGELASLSTGYFLTNLERFIPEKKGTFPRFDARVWNVPDLQEAANVFVWRERDATKNSISMAAQAVYSHNQLMNKTGSEKQDMLFSKGINWNYYPSYFKKGTYVKKLRKEIAFTTEELDKLPPKHLARIDPLFKVERNIVSIIDVPPIDTIEDKVYVLFKANDNPKLEY